ncbi:hypothetical protein NL676_037633 [Syzygium grande]|nr:hypothetical protein NL676_037633 [Syzygium grande]
MGLIGRPKGPDEAQSSIFRHDAVSAQRRNAGKWGNDNASSRSRRDARRRRESAGGGDGDAEAKTTKPTGPSMTAVSGLA